MDRLIVLSLGRQAAPSIDVRSVWSMRRSAFQLPSFALHG